MFLQVVRNILLDSGFDLQMRNTGFRFWRRQVGFPYLKKEDCVNRFRICYLRLKLFSGFDFSKIFHYINIWRYNTQQCGSFSKVNYYFASFPSVIHTVIQPIEFSKERTFFLLFEYLYRELAISRRIFDLRNKVNIFFVENKHKLNNMVIIFEKLHILNLFSQTIQIF